MFRKPTDERETRQKKAEDIFLICADEASTQFAGAPSGSSGEDEGIAQALARTLRPVPLIEERPSKEEPIEEDDLTNY